MACGDGSSDESDSSRGTAAETPAEATPADATVDTLRIAVENLGAQTPDPHLARNEGGGYIVVAGIGENLARRDLDNNLVPNLAESWEISDDGLSWTFTLREGVKMQDGSDFTARDVKTAIDRVRADDFTVGFASIQQVVEDVTVIDPLHVTITTNTPFVTLLDDMPEPIPTDYYNEVGEQGFRDAPLAAGSFKFVSQQINRGMTFERFDDFWDPTRLANFTTLEVLIITDESARIAALLSGDVDAAHGLSPRSVDRLETEPDVRLLEKDAIGMSFLYFNDLNLPDSGTPFLDADVRKALSLAIDRESIAEELYRGLATPTANFWPSATPGYDDSLEADPYDPERARELLEEAGYPDLHIELGSKDTDAIVTDIQNLGQLIQSYWTDIGATVTYTPVERQVGSAYNKDFSWPSGAQIAGFPGNLLLDPGIPSDIVFLSDGGSPRVNDPQLDELVLDLRSIIEPEARAEAGLAVTRYVAEKAYAVPLFEMKGTVAIGPNIAEWQQQTSFAYGGPWWYLRAA